MKRFVSLGCLIWVLGFMLSGLNPAAAADASLDEADLFSGETTVAEAEVVSENVDQELKEQRFGVSGEVATESVYTNFTARPNWLGSKFQDDFESQLSTDVFFDFRFKNNVKSFFSLGAYYYVDPAANALGPGETARQDLLLKEGFIDFNWQNKVYFRAGKQVLKWGRSYFWNPTDLINVEKKDFFDLDKNREGTTGIKMHIPSGVVRNIYLFAGLEDADRLEEVSLAGKYEWLVGKSEMSFSVWYKDDYHPVFGYDLSSRLGKYNWQCEISLADGKDVTKFDDALILTTLDKWYPQVSLGLTRTFNHGGIADRISLTGELFYNQAGYDENIFAKIATQASDETEKKKLIDAFMKDYQTFLSSRYYLAIFSSVNKFLMPELTLDANVIANLVDHSFSVNTGLTYQPTLKDIYLTFNINNFFGAPESEARFLGNIYHLVLGLKVLF